MADDDLASATGLAIAVIAHLIERHQPIPKGEVARLLSLLSKTAAPDRPRQQAVLEQWVQILTTAPIANDR